ncbi:MAG TPA: PKD domain-containing protein, partial [Vicinamibacterales bacterium]
YLRRTGQPVTEVDTFSATPGAYTLRITNGGLLDQYARVTSAEIFLNDVLIAGPSAFSPQVAAITIPVTLAATNVIRVELRGQPSSGLTIDIEGEGGEVNNPPTANAGPDQSAAVGGTVTLDGSASSDPDGDALTFNWVLTTRPAGSSAALSDPAAVNPSFVVDRSGTYVARLIVNDGQVSSAADFVTITVANRPPTANAGADQSAAVGTLITLDGSASTDPDGDALTYEWSFVSVPAGSAAFLVNPASVAPTFTIDEPGSYVVGLIVNDGQAASAQDTVTITTSNSAPVANAGPDQTTTVGATVTLDGSGSSDADGDSLTFTWTLTSRPVGSTATLVNPDTASPTLSIDRPGSYIARLIVNDGTAASAADFVTITTLNSVPVANAGADQTARVGDTVTLDGSTSSDVDGDSLSFRWSFASKPAGSGAVLSDAFAVAPSFTIDLPGAYVVQLIVNDGLVDSAPDTVTITTSNSAPVANAGEDRTAAVGSTQTLDGSLSTDADGDVLTFAWSFTSRPAGSAAVLSNADTVAPSFVVDRPGTYIVQLIVNDGTADSAPDTVVISTINSAPVANAGADQTVPVAGMAILDGSASSDVDGDPLTYSWALIAQPPGSTATLQNATSVSPQLTPDRPGSYVVQLIVNDGTVDSVPDTVVVSTVNSPPVANAGADQSAFVGDTITLNGGASTDIDGDALTYAWAITARPAGSAAVLSDPASVSPSFTIDAAGSYVVQLIVNDGLVNSAPDTVTISTLNSRPVANAGADQSVVAGDTVTLDGSASTDADGDPLSYQWAITVRPAGSAAVLSDPTAAQPTFVADRGGDYVIQLIVSDASESSTPDTVSVVARILVPNVVGALQADATATITGSQLALGALSSRYDAAVPAGRVITQSPVAGTIVPAGSAIDLEISLGPTPIEIPDVTGMTQAEAEAAIVAAGFVVGPITNEASNTIPAGRVIRLDPPIGSSVPPGTVISIVVSTGPAAPALQSIAVTAAAALLARGQQQQYTAIGTWTDGHTENITATATWSSTNPAVANVTSAGVGEAFEAGNTVIQASQNGVTGGAALTVVDAALTSIVVTPATAILLVGQPQTFTAQGVLSDGTGQALAGVAWSSNNNAALQINPATGAATAMAAGPVTVSATVGTIVGTAAVTVQDLAASDVTNPVAAITSPADSATLTDVANIVGTATDANFSQYILDYAVVGTSSFTTITIGTAPVNAGGVLGQFDPTLLANDIYTVRLRVFDRAGRITTISRTYTVTRDVKVGAFSLTFQDLIVPAGNLPIVINRIYDTRDKSVGEFGVGSRLDIQTMRLRATPTLLGSSWQQTRSGGFLPNYCIVPVGEHKITITLPDNKVEEFDMVGPPCQQVVPIDFGDVSFTARAGTRGTLVPLDNTSFFWSGGAPGLGELLDDGTFDILNPQRFRYTTWDGYAYTISRTGGVEMIRDPNNNTVTIGPGGITHSNGKSVVFTRDASNRITQIAAPGGEVHRYAYNAAGDLSQYTDAAASITRYFYNLSHGLIEIRDPRGMRPVRNEYDDSGRLVATIDAQGNRIEYAHDLSANRETVTDRLGRVRLLEYDATGNITRETHADGSTTQRTFDARGNALTQTNELGGVVTSTYNALDLPLTRRDELNNLVESYTYDAMGNRLTYTDGRGNVTTYTYDARGNRLTMRDGEGFLTQWTYDGNGNVLTITDPRGAVTTNVYDAASNLTRKTDPTGVTNYTYDAAGRRLSETRTRAIPGGTETVETRFGYDAAGRLIETTHPDGTTTR